jgi:hypothetical protein
VQAAAALPHTAAAAARRLPRLVVGVCQQLHTHLEDVHVSGWLRHTVPNARPEPSVQIRGGRVRTASSRLRRLVVIMREQLHPQLDADQGSSQRRQVMPNLRPQPGVRAWRRRVCCGLRGVRQGVERRQIVRMRRRLLQYSKPSCLFEPSSIIGTVPSGAGVQSSMRHPLPELRALW